MSTKLEEILLYMDMSQGDLIRRIQENTGHRIGRDRMSKICTGKLKNYTVKTAVMIKEALDISLDDFVEYPLPKKNVSM